MSAYKEIKSEFRNGQSLIKALKVLGLIPQVSQNLRDNGVELVNNYGHDGAKVAIGVDRIQVHSKINRSVYGGLGFTWNGKSYDVIADDLDVHKTEHQKLMNDIKQRYSYNEIKRQAQVKGYTVRETTGQDGVIRMTLVHR
jgi:hypothetical protein